MEKSLKKNVIQKFFIVKRVMPQTQGKERKFFCCENFLSGKSHCRMVIIICSRFAAMGLCTDHPQKDKQEKGEEKCPVQKKFFLEYIPFFQFLQIITGKGIACLMIFFAAVFFRHDFPCCLLFVPFNKKYSCEILFSTFSAYFYRNFPGEVKKIAIFFPAEGFLC